MLPNSISNYKNFSKICNALEKTLSDHSVEQFSQTLLELEGDTEFALKAAILCVFASFHWGKNLQNIGPKVPKSM